MSKALVLQVVIAAGCLIGLSRSIAVAGEDPNVVDLARIAGTWEIISDVYSGTKDGSLCATGQLVVFSGSKMTVVDKNQVNAHRENEGATFSIDATKTPKRMNWWWMVEDIRAEGYAIYSLEGDVMRICFVAGNSVEPRPERPTKLESPRGSRVSLWTLSRLRPKERAGPKRQEP